MTLRRSLGQRQLSAYGSRCETFAGVTCRAIEIGGVFIVQRQLRRCRWRRRRRRRLRLHFTYSRVGACLCV